MDDQLLQATLDNLRRSAAQNQQQLSGPPAAQLQPGPMGGTVAPVPEPAGQYVPDVAALQASDAQVSGQLAQGAEYPTEPGMAGATDMRGGIVTTNPFGPPPASPELAALQASDAQVSGQLAQGAEYPQVTPPTFQPAPLPPPPMALTPPMGMPQQSFMPPAPGGPANPYGPPAPVSVPNASGGVNFYGPQHEPVGYGGGNPYLQQLLQQMMGGGR